jgi:hypothetical protein
MTDRISRGVSGEGLAAEKDRTAPPSDDARKPDSPSDLTAGSWRYAVKQAWAEFRRDECTDLAAALTYYAVLSSFGLDHWGRYLDEFGVVDGEWLITRRTVTTEGVDPDGWAAVLA